MPPTAGTEQQGSPAPAQPAQLPFGTPCLSHRQHSRCTPRPQVTLLLTQENVIYKVQQGSGLLGPTLAASRSPAHEGPRESQGPGSRVGNGSRCNEQLHAHTLPPEGCSVSRERGWRTSRHAACPGPGLLLALSFWEGNTCFPRSKGSRGGGQEAWTHCPALTSLWTRRPWIFAGTEGELQRETLSLPIHHGQRPGPTPSTSERPFSC